MDNQYSNNWHNDDYSVPQYRKEITPKKDKKNVSVAVLLVVTVLLSAGLGFGGGLLANRMNDRNEAIDEAMQNPGVTIEQLAAADSSAFNAAAVAAVGMDSVVEITTESMSRNNLIMGQYVTTGAGSGVIISEGGYIVTNNHVINGASKITVRTRDGKEFPASIVGYDERTDLAVIKVETNGLRAAAFGASGELVVGQRVLAIGNPLGELGGTVTEGIISALDREVEIEGQSMTLLQTDASVNPGNSGGGLFDGSGKLVGIVNAKSSGSGIEGLGFAIPIDTARDVVDELINNGYVSGRPEAGISVTYIDEQTAFLYRMGEGGVYISAVNRGSAAEQAGLQAGDRIVSVDGKEIKENHQVVDIVQSHKAGDTVEFKIVRKNEKLTVKVTLDEQKPTFPPLS